MFKLPDYSVVVHIINTEFSKDLRFKIEEISSSYEIDEESEYLDRKEYHWMFDSWEEAVVAGENLKQLTSNPNLLLLKVKAPYEKKRETLVFKDLISPKKN